MRRAEQVRYLVLAAQREGNRLLAAALRSINLTPSQAEVLRLLGDHAPLTIGRVGELLVCESGVNPSRLIDRLVTAGLVHRRPGDDRRRVLLDLTEEGRRREHRVRVIEDALYDAIDAAGDPSAAVDYLHLLVAGSPAGNAIAARQMTAPGLVVPPA
ncbi:MAG: winged helix DNA-binding protein [Salinibacterium sp.]|nr:winged helix DNA-binding protein [Salinibacterium sp.]